jgi:CheY-like chemotaxis protein
MAYRYDGLRVLVVDDNLHMRVLVTAVLSAFGIHDIVEASSADEAWAAMLEKPADIIFVDWGLIGMSGLDLTEKFRNDPASPNPFVPIVMLTGHTSDERMRAARDAGVHEFLTKPVSSKGLMACLETVIENPRPFVRTETYFGPCRRREANPAYDGPERRLAESASVVPAKAADAA